MTSRYLSIDLGAESGRVMLGTLEDGRIALEELSRFSNTPIRDGERMYWNIPALLDGIRAATSIVRERCYKVLTEIDVFSNRR